MSRTVKYRCINCGERFKTEVLTEREIDAAKRENQPLGPIRCPKCGRSDYREGWE